MGLILKIYILLFLLNVKSSEFSVPLNIFIKWQMATRCSRGRHRRQASAQGGRTPIGVALGSGCVQALAQADPEVASHVSLPGSQGLLTSGLGAKVRWSPPAARGLWAAKRKPMGSPPTLSRGMSGRVSRWLARTWEKCGLGDVWWGPDAMRLCVPGLGDPARKAENSEGQREVEVGEQGCRSGRTSAERPDPGGTQAEAAPVRGAHFALYFYCIFCPQDVKEMNTRP